MAHLYLGLCCTLILLVCSSIGGPTFNDGGRPETTDATDIETENDVDGMMDIMRENQDIDGVGNVIGDHGHIVEGDIFEELEDHEQDESTRKRRNALRDRKSLWPGGAIPYVIDGYFTDNHKKHILGAMQRFHEKTCIRFVPRTIERDYILFTQSLGCWSMVGRTGGRQKISLSGTCRGSRGVIMHELMHAIGFRHEHNRPDRDGYISIYWQNIKEGFTTNFRKYSNDQVQTLGTGYDFLSLMHYPLTAFSKEGNSMTIGPRYPTYQLGDVGNRNDFSHIDVYRINYLYKCGQCEDTDKYYCPIWAMMGECQANKEWMTKYCPFSCDRCNIALAKGDGLACIDRTSNCKRWSKIGECERNPEYMLHDCRRSCKQCMAVNTETGEDEGLSCTDDNTLCYDWATLGECESNAKFMMRHCRRSCHVCTGGDGRIVIDTESPDCQDTTPECAVWATRNMCKERRSWMAERCRRSCLWCSPSIRTIQNASEDTREEDESNREIDESDLGRQRSEVDDFAGDRKAPSVLGEGTSEAENVAGNPENNDEMHFEKELYGGAVNSTGWYKPQGCVDEHDVCDKWAEAGDCASNPEWMAIKCPVSCGLCGDSTVQPACVDRHRNCSHWSTIGECDAFPDWMHAKCPQSCDLCGPTQAPEGAADDCFDEHVFCENFAKMDKCDPEHIWMRVYCRKSCDFCRLPRTESPCMDTQFRCKELADKGECRTNRGWMAYQCPLSCGTCQKQDKFKECRDKTRNCRVLATEGHCHFRRSFMAQVCPYSCGVCRVGNTLRSGRYKSFPESLQHKSRTSLDTKRRSHQSLKSPLRLSTIYRIIAGSHRTNTRNRHRLHSHMRGSLTI